MTRCTCIYRASNATERAAGATVISVASRDPWCPAAALHDRVAADAQQADDDRRAAEAQQAAGVQQPPS